MKKYWDQLEVGHKIPQFEYQAVTRTQIAQVAVASFDCSPLYLDDEFAKAAGFSSSFAPNIISLSFLEKSFYAFANNIKIIHLSGTFHKIIRPNDKITAHGLLVQHYQLNNENRAKFDIWCLNQNEDLIMKGLAECLLFKNEKEERNQNLKIPQISKATKDELLQKFKDDTKSPKQRQSSPHDVLA